MTQSVATQKTKVTVENKAFTSENQTFTSENQSITVGKNFFTGNCLKQQWISVSYKGNAFLQLVIQKSKSELSPK